MDTDCCAGYTKREAIGSCGSVDSALIVSPTYQQAVDNTGRSYHGHSQSQEVNPGSSGSRKRGRESEEEVVVGGGEKVVEKRGCEEGMSWWTCLMLGMDQENTKPRVVRKLHTQQN